MDKLKALFLKYKEIIVYIIVGGMTTLVRWGTVVIFEDIFSPVNMNPQLLSFLVTFCSLAVTILFAFPPNKTFVFESKSFKGSIVLKEFGAFLGARAVASLIELAGIPLLAMWLRIETIWVTMIVSVVVLVLNYIFSKLVVFKNRTGEKKEKSKKNSSTEVVEIRKKDKTLSIVLNAVCAVVFVVSVAFYTVDVITKIFP